MVPVSMNKNIPFCAGLGHAIHSKNCSPAPDLLLREPTFQRAFLLPRSFFHRHRYPEISHSGDPYLGGVRCDRLEHVAIPRRTCLFCFAGDLHLIIHVTPSSIPMATEFGRIWSPRAADAWIGEQARLLPVSVLRFWVFRGFDSGRILIIRGGILMSMQRISRKLWVDEWWIYYGLTHESLYSDMGFETLDLNCLWTAIPRNGRSVSHCTALYWATLSFAAYARWWVDKVLPKPLVWYVVFVCLLVFVGRLSLIVICLFSMQGDFRPAREIRLPWFPKPRYTHEAPVCYVAPTSQLLRIGSQMQEVWGSNPRLGGLGVSPFKGSGGISALQARASGLQSSRQGIPSGPKRLLRFKRADNARAKVRLHSPPAKEVALASSHPQ